MNIPFVHAQTEITIQIGASSDDTRVSDGDVTHPPFDSMAALTALGLTAGAHSPNYFGSGFRFLNITIPSGAIIQTAKLQLNARQSKSLGIVNTRITGEDTDNSLTFANITYYNSRNRTTEFIDWDTIPAWVTNTWYDTPDITDVIQEIINRTGWVSGNNLTVFWEDHGSTLLTNRYRQAKAYDHDPNSAPRLIITYIIPQYLTFYFNNGGQFRVDNATMNNGTTQFYDYGSVIELASLPQNSSYVFSIFEWDSTNATTNPYDLTINSNLTVWLYFSVPEVGGYAGFSFLFFGLLMGLTIGVLVGFGLKK